jgi:Zinc finger, C3HC4 type (RING finger)
MDTLSPDIIPGSFERVRRPYSGSPQNPPVRPHSEGTLSDDIESLLLVPEEAIPERRRRQYSLSSREPPPHISPSSPPAASHSPPASPPPTSNVTDLHKIAEEGIDVSTLSTSTLLAIMRANNCPRPSGAIEKEDLIDRVEEMVSFIIAGPQLQPAPDAEARQPRVRDEDEDDCRICYERIADYCLVPCGHTGFCFLCARKMEECPFCKAKIGHAQKLWKV